MYKESIHIFSVNPHERGPVPISRIKHSFESSKNDRRYIQDREVDYLQATPRE